MSGTCIFLTGEPEEITVTEEGEDNGDDDYKDQIVLKVNKSADAEENEEEDKALEEEELEEEDSEYTEAEDAYVDVEYTEDDEEFEEEDEDYEEYVDEDENYTDDEEAQIMDKQQKDLIQKIHINSYQRSGSSFIGKLFDVYEPAFFVYEPLEMLYTALYGVSEDNVVPHNIFFDHRGDYR